MSCNHLLQKNLILSDSIIMIVMVVMIVMIIIKIMIKIIIKIIITHIFLQVLKHDFEREKKKIQANY